jgi:hypothetical protein
MNKNGQTIKKPIEQMGDERGHEGRKRMGHSAARSRRRHVGGENRKSCVRMACNEKAARVVGGGVCTTEGAKRARGTRGGSKGMAEDRRLYNVGWKSG